MRDFNRYEKHLIQYNIHVRYLLTRGLASTQFISPVLRASISDSSFYSLILAFKARLHHGRHNLSY
jgi:hypothetical protein